MSFFKNPVCVKVINTKGFMDIDESDFKIGQITKFISKGPINALPSEQWKSIEVKYDDNSVGTLIYSLTIDNKTTFFFTKKDDMIVFYK